MNSSGMALWNLKVFDAAATRGVLAVGPRVGAGAMVLGARAFWTNEKLGCGVPLRG
jgi:hypothetical protein